jgi:hypothetical protein
MLDKIRRSPFGLGLALGLSLGVSALIGGAVTWLLVGPTELVLPETALHATATHGGDTLAVATGPVDDEMEGLFVLDYVTGELQCTVLNYRSATFNAIFKTNVLKDLGVDATRKRPQYLMVTGQSRFPRAGPGGRLALTVVYVVDENTGNFAAYGLPWLPEMARAGRPQTGAMIPLDAGNARAAVVRD